MPVYIVWNPGNAPLDENGNLICAGTQSFTGDDGTGHTQVYYVQITFYLATANGQPCADPSVELLTHELGHALQLDATSDPNCVGRIMYLTGVGRQIFPDDCDAVDRMWPMPNEPPDPPPYDPLQDMYCAVNCWAGYCENGVCPSPPWASCPSCSPIIIALDGRPFQLTGLESPVTFDIDANGNADTISWTKGGSSTGLLCLDRDGDGIVNNGRELFGNNTPLPLAGGIAANGFVALAEYDKRGLGGNEDGMIDEHDAVYSKLRIWLDRSHNGRSEPGELLTLPQAGVIRIDLPYVQEPHQDRFGNAFRYRGHAWLGNPRQAPSPTDIWDVYFVRQH